MIEYSGEDAYCTHEYEPQAVDSYAVEEIDTAMQECVKSLTGRIRFLERELKGMTEMAEGARDHRARHEERLAVVTSFLDWLVCVDPGSVDVEAIVRRANRTHVAYNWN